MVAKIGEHRMLQRAAIRDHCGAGWGVPARPGEWSGLRDRRTIYMLLLMSPPARRIERLAAERRHSAKDRGVADVDARPSSRAALVEQRDWSRRKTPATPHPEPRDCDIEEAGLGTGLPQARGEIAAARRLDRSAQGRNVDHRHALSRPMLLLCQILHARTAFITSPTIAECQLIASEAFSASPEPLPYPEPIRTDAQMPTATRRQIVLPVLADAGSFAPLGRLIRRQRRRAKKSMIRRMRRLELGRGTSAFDIMSAEHRPLNFQSSHAASVVTQCLALVGTASPG